VRALVSRRGLTLVEVLVALAIGSLVITLASATSLSSRRMNVVLDARAVAGQRSTAVPQLVGGALALAGRGMDGCGLQLLDEGRRVRVRGVDIGDALPSTIEVFAGLDGGGRPALYHRTLPYARQPWLEDVVGFEVVAAQDEHGAWREVVHDTTTRWTALRMTVSWTDNDVRTYERPLPHSPCAEIMP
jgi:prepilin-type N-terminal cleavage/methylation domain-containing protein